MYGQKLVAAAGTASTCNGFPHNILCSLVAVAGLDARAAAIVMRAVRNVALSGRTVMVTIHQPSIEIFEAFDTLLLLQVGLCAATVLRWPTVPVSLFNQPCNAGSRHIFPVTGEC